MGGVIEEVMREGKVVGLNLTWSRSMRFYTKNKTARLASGPFLGLFFFPIFKIQFIFSRETFPLVVALTEPPVKIDFHGRVLTKPLVEKSIFTCP